MTASLKELSYYKTGGLCQVLLSPISLDELQEALLYTRAQGLAYFLLGAGSNSLIMDEFWPGAVISFHRLKKMSAEGSSLRCEAGLDNTVLAHYAYQHGLQGISWMNRLPGQIGATVRMNARCYGGEISQVVSKIKAVSPDGDILEFLTPPGSAASKAVFRAYKDTVFMSNGALIAEVEMQLQPGKRIEILQQMQACEKDREKKGQFLHPSCGCIFKNDYSPEVSIPSGMLLQEAGVRNLKQGAAQISPSHANFVYNTGSAGSLEILHLALEMRECVWRHFGVWLSFEMEILGSLSSELKKKVHERREPTYRQDRLGPLRRKFAEKS
ncbi:MAG: UDP-N-acetylmuramate dehydrogenase [Oligoflexales bacterium]|nr:UDP-N-acetylmuramate dehydrogenase [Oligoflexales bacterium]